MPGLNAANTSSSLVDTIQLFILFLMGAFFAISGTFG